MMTVEEALIAPDLLQGLMAAPPSVRRLVFWAVFEFDKQRAAKRNPTLAAMREAVPDSLMAEIVADSRRGNVPAPSSMASTPGAPPPPEPQRGTGWVQPHIPDRTNDFALMDRLVEGMVGGPNDTRKLK
jgi:hypothetical protein